MNIKNNNDSEISLVKAISYIKSNFSDEELAKIPSKDWKIFNSKLIKYNYNGQLINFEMLDDNSKTIIIAILKKYYFDNEQNKKFDEIFETIESYHKTGVVNNG